VVSELTQTIQIAAKQRWKIVWVRILKPALGALYNMHMDAPTWAGLLKNMLLHAHLHYIDAATSLK